MSTLFVGRTESYAKSNRTSSQGAVGLSQEALTSVYQDFRPKTINQRVIDRYEVYFDYYDLANKLKLRQ